MELDAEAWQGSVLHRHHRAIRGFGRHPQAGRHGRSNGAKAVVATAGHGRLDGGEEPGAPMGDRAGLAVDRNRIDLQFSPLRLDERLVPEAHAEDRRRVG